MTEGIENLNQRTMTQTTNDSFMTPNALQLRLDSSQILHDIEITLRGFRTVIVQNEQGEPIQILEKVGEPLANERGIHWIMGFVKTLINPQFVQGNWNEDRFIEFNVRTRIKFAKDLMLNLYTYEIKTKDYPAICDLVCIHLEGFTSRLQDNKEREGYVGTVMAHEISKGNEQNMSKGFSLFSRSK